MRVTNRTGCACEASPSEDFANNRIPAASKFSIVVEMKVNFAARQDVP
jgi:hypothetical protein